MAQLLTGALAQVDQARDQLRAGHPELAAGLGGRGGAGTRGQRSGRRALLHAEVEVDALGGARLRELGGLQLVDVAREEVVRRALVDEEREGRAAVRVDQLDRVVRLARLHRA